jgi:D-alanyl-D-alanine carboxypeptidase
MKKLVFSFVTIIIIFSILTLIFSFFSKTNKVYSINIENATSTQGIFKYGLEAAVISTDFLNKTKSSFITQKADFIEVDLNKMVLSLYKNGVSVLNYKVQSKGRPGSWWETPAGLYKIELKEKTHFSSIGKVYQPWSMQFQGNFFIHGWPYYENGQETSTQFTGGCIKLNTVDAKNLYREVLTGIPVLVFNQEQITDNFMYLPNLPELASDNYLVADLKNNFIFVNKNSSELVPIASVTKLMTALVASEYINLGKNIPINKISLVSTSKSRLVSGTSIEAFELLHLLLEESSNEAAEVLAGYLGKERFVQLMNKKALAIGLKNTTFVDPSGIGGGNVSSAEDLFILAKYIYNNRSFIFKISTGLLNTGINENFSFPKLNNFNEFVGEEGFVGGKVGETIIAKQTILSVFDLPLKDGVSRPIVFISLGSSDRKEDVIKLKNYIKEYFNY